MTNNPNSDDGSNPFVLPGLGNHTVAAGRRLAAEAKRRQPQPKPDDEYDWDDGPSESLLPTGSLTESLAAHHGTPVEPEGDWSDWLDPTSHRAPTSPEDEDYPGVEYDDWDDDWGEEGTRHPHRRPAMATTVWWRAREMVSHAWPTISAVAVTVGIVATVTTVVMLNVRDTTETAAPPPPDDARAIGAAPTAAPADTPSTVEDHAVAGCRSTSTGSTTIGAGAGDTSSRQGVILALEWAYYVDRSAAAVRALTTPDAAVPPEHVVQAGIDAQPEGTRYCVYISPADDSGAVWDVQLHEQWPSEDQPSEYAQTITTTTKDGEPLITGIHAVE